MAYGIRNISETTMEGQSANPLHGSTAKLDGTGCEDNRWKWIVFFPDDSPELTTRWRDPTVVTRNDSTEHV
jgi:hypothetical protein